MKYYCKLPSVHYEVKANGHVAPCFVSKTEYKDENGIPYNVSKTDIFEILNSKHATQIRNDLLQDKPVKGCDQCYFEDKQPGAVSRRVRENNHFKEFSTTGDFVHRYVDLKLGNTCNNACMICSPDLSSKWAEQYSQANWKFDRTNNNKNFNWYENQQYWDDLLDNIDEITNIDIYGGEPFLIKQQWKFIEKLVDLGHAEHIILNYATNGTVYPQHAIDNLWPEFKKVSLIFSSDGIKDVHDYSRWPSKWELFETNLRKFCDNGFVPYIGFSISNYSVWDITRSLEYYYNNFKHYDNFKIWFNNVYNSGSDIACLPAELKELLIDRLTKEWDDKYKSIMHSEKTIESIISHIKQDAVVDKRIASEDKWESFVKRVQTFDKIRNLKIEDVVPEYKGYIK